MKKYLVAACVLLLALPGQALPQSSERLSGAFVHFGYGQDDDAISEARIPPLFDELQHLGNDTLIITQTRVTSGGRGCATDAGDFEWVSGFPSKLKTILDHAHQRGMKVHVGTTFSALECADFLGPSNTAVVERDVRLNLSVLHDAYGEHPAFAGWYIADEPGVVGSDTHPFYRRVRAALREISPGKPTAVSPFLAGWNLPGPALLAEAAGQFRDATGIELQIWQDGVGAFANAKLPHWDRPGFSTDEYFTALSASLGSGLWANVELFNQGSPLFHAEAGIFTGAYRPASAQRIRQQLRSTRAAAKRVSWLNQIHLSNAGVQGAFVEGARAQAGYRSVFGIGSARMLVPLDSSNYSWLTAPDSSYADNGRKMFDGRTGNPADALDSGWVGILGEARIRIDLGTSRRLDWVGVHTLSKPAWGIRSPGTVTILCGRRPANLKVIATASAPFSLTPLTGSVQEEYVLGNTTPLGADCRYLELHLPNGHWTFLSEIELSRD